MVAREDEHAAAQPAVAHASANWPFDAWLRLAVSAYRLSPSEFWALSVRDWLVLTRAQPVPSLGRAEFEKLHAKYPDIGDENESN